MRTEGLSKKTPPVYEQAGNPLQSSSTNPGLRLLLITDQGDIELATLKKPSGASIFHIFSHLIVLHHKPRLCFNREPHFFPTQMIKFHDSQAFPVLSQFAAAGEILLSIMCQSASCFGA